MRIEMKIEPNIFDRDAMLEGEQEMRTPFLYSVYLMEMLHLYYKLLFSAVPSQED